jgi:GT2 family glycosyltransferase
MPVDLTLSIINHSNPRLLQGCLRSLFAATHQITLDVWVVDNATGGELMPELQAEFPQVHWLFNPKRLGFSANHNQVLRQASGRYACILNDDTVIHDGAFDTLVAYLDAHPKVGMAGAKLLNADGTLQNCTFRFMTLWSELIGICLLPGPLNVLKTVGIDPIQSQDKPARVEWVLGACIIVRDTALRQIGLLDALLSPVANTEEVDWCYRAHQAGWEVAYCPDAMITHIGGQSMKLAAPGRDKFRVEMYRTRLAFFRKHHGLLQTSLLRLIYLTTLPWNALMLTQSALRKTEPASQCRNAFATLCSIASVSLKTKVTM